MERSIEILTELQEIAPTLIQTDAPRLPYGLPAGFFEQFPALLMERIRTETSLNREGLADLSPVSSRQEIAEISSLLAGLQHKNPYQVPEGYFDKIYGQLPMAERATGGQNERTIPIRQAEEWSEMQEMSAVQSTPVIPFSRIIKYSVAACIVILLGINLITFSYHSLPFSDPISGLKSVSDQDMANYLDNYDVHWTPGLGNGSETASVELSDNDIHELFSNVGDEELEQYMPPLSEEKGTVN